MAVARRPPKKSGAPIGVHSTVWTREVSEDGRVYFFNKGTGASQWHLPNDLYKPRFFKKQMIFHDLQKMPGSARALLGVDCVTELPPKRAKSNLAQEIASKLFGGQARKEYEPEVIEPVSILKMNVLSATGLRDADFMPGRDKSDPYCTVEIMGKTHSLFKTPVVQDCLDPVWNYSDMLVHYTKGDIIVITVWDKDDDVQDLNSKRLAGGGKLLFDEGDDLLGRLMLTQDELHTTGVQEFQLEEAGEGHEAFIRIECEVLMAWPDFLGQLVTEVLGDVKRACPHLNAIAVEEPDPGHAVVSFDALHAREGYTGNFFGAYEKDMGHLAAGDKIDVGRHRFTFSHMGPPHVNPKNGKTMRYLFIREDITGVIRDGVVWKKVATLVPDPGVVEDRVLVWFSPYTQLVTRVPFIG